MFTYKKARYKIFVLGPKFCWAGPGGEITSASMDGWTILGYPTPFAKKITIRLTRALRVFVNELFKKKNLISL